MWFTSFPAFRSGGAIPKGEGTSKTKIERFTL